MHNFESNPSALKRIDSAQPQAPTKNAEEENEAFKMTDKGEIKIGSHTLEIYCEPDGPDKGYAVMWLLDYDEKDKEKAPPRQQEKIFQCIAKSLPEEYQEKSVQPEQLSFSFPVSVKEKNSEHNGNIRISDADANKMYQAILDAMNANAKNIRFLAQDVTLNDVDQVLLGAVQKCQINSDVYEKLMKELQSRESPGR